MIKTKENHFNFGMPINTCLALQVVTPANCRGNLSQYSTSEKDDTMYSQSIKTMLPDTISPAVHSIANYNVTRWQHNQLWSIEIPVLYWYAGRPTRLVCGWWNYICLFNVLHSDSSLKLRCTINDTKIRWWWKYEKSRWGWFMVCVGCTLIMSAVTRLGEVFMAERLHPYHELSSILL